MQRLNLMSRLAERDNDTGVIEVPRVCRTLFRDLALTSIPDNVFRECTIPGDRTGDAPRMQI